MGCGHCGTGGVWEAYPVGRGSLVAWNRYSAPGWHRLAGDWEGFGGRPGVPGSTSPAIRFDTGLIAREEPSSSGPQTSPQAVDENGRKSLLSRRLYSAECLRSRAFFGRSHTPSQGQTSRLPGLVAPQFKAVTASAAPERVYALAPPPQLSNPRTAVPVFTPEGRAERDLLARLRGEDEAKLERLRGALPGCVERMKRGTHNFSERAAGRRGLFPEGTEVVANARAKRHRRNEAPPGNIPPRRGVAEAVTHLLGTDPVFWHPCLGAAQSWGSGSGGVAGARPPQVFAATSDASCIRLRCLRHQSPRASAAKFNLKPKFQRND